MSTKNPEDFPRPVVDAHCHVDLYPSPERIIAEAENEQIHTVAVTNAPSVFFHTQSLTRGSRFVRPAVGLHPELVQTRGHELDRLWPLLDETRFVGEIGLDYVTEDAEDRRQQMRTFRSILERCADYGDKVLTIHSRRSSADVISAIGAGYPGTIILHWFSGPKRDLTTAIEYGAYFSVNPAMTRSASGKKLIAMMPPNKVLTESDGPFVRCGSRPCCPSDTAQAIAYLAACWHCSAADAAERVLQNFLGIVAES